MGNSRMYVMTILLAIYAVVNGKISKVGTRGDGEEDLDTEISALTVSRTIAEVGKIFEYGMVGEINKVKKVGDVEKMGFFMRKIPSLKHIPKLAGTFGALGTLLSIAFSFIPEGDSPEIILMKKEFSEMNRKLDIITNSIDESKKLIKEYSQKSAYIQAEHKIIQAYAQLNTTIFSVMNIPCVSKEDCKYKKIKVVENHKDKLDVRGEVEMILRGATRHSVFGIPLLSLISDTSGCYINKIETFKSDIAALTLKGSLATALYDMLTKYEYDIAEGVRRFQTLMFHLEKKSEEIILKCYENVNRYIISDAIDLDQKLSKSSIEDANEYTLQYLSMKYPWIEFYVITADVSSKPLFWANDSFHYEWNSFAESENKKTKNFILIGSRNLIENKIDKEARFRGKVMKTRLHYKSWLTVKYDEAISRLLGVVQYDKYLHGQFRTITVIPKFSNARIGYVKEDGAIERVDLRDYNKISKNDIFAYNQCDGAITCSEDYQPVAVIATVHSKDQDIHDCSNTCNLQGSCFFLPHTKIMGCKCNDNYYGDDCSFSASEKNIAFDLIKLIDISFKLPTLFGVSTQLDKVRTALQADFNDIESSIREMDERLTILFDTFSDNLIATLNLHGLITQYGQMIRDMKYYYDILIEKDVEQTDVTYHEIASLHEKLPNMQLKEKEELAKEVFKPTELRRSLKYLRYLFTGRKDIPLISHEPLLFLIMDKHRSKVCTHEYKQILDNAFIQLAILEFEGHVLWMHALKLLHRDTSFVVQHYNDSVMRHTTFLGSNTCKVNITNSINFADCNTGYYIHPGMKEQVECTDNFYLTNESVSLYANEVLGVSSQTSKALSLTILGPQDVYPSYGKNIRAWSPSRCTEFEYIEVAFKDPLYIEEIMIYETYHGGSVWKVEGLDKQGKWRIIQEISSKHLRNIETARIYKIRQKINWSTSTLRLNINCKKYGKAINIDAVKINGRPVEGTCSWYDSFSCTPCGCNPVGSTSSTCSADGQCRCKSNYKGKRCLSRDCVIGQWTAWSSCECGPGKTKTRTRPITQKSAGSGRPCDKRKETIACNVKCLCKEDERGELCEHKDCLVSEWNSWSTCPKTVKRFRCNGKDEEFVERKRYRTITRAKEKNGKICPNLNETENCPNPLCQTWNRNDYHKYSLYGK